MQFIDEVIAWYNTHRRSLPWRNTSDAYIIWLSEIIMQQTRVEQGLPYFERFVENFPNVEQFAAASEDQILNLWQGLGYYSRARNMHHTARQVLSEHGGVFPTNYHELLKLKGIGEYTAAAISSFAANEPHAVVDGNVFRLLARYYGISEAINSSKGKALFTKVANESIDKLHAGLSNQALMEFGSLQCRPQNPYCDTCPLRVGCYAFEHKAQARLPVKQAKQPVRNRYFNYLLVKNNDRVLMHRRGAGDIWQHLYELPLIESSRPLNSSELEADPAFKALFGSEAFISLQQGPVKHLLSHQRLHACFFTVKGAREDHFADNGFFYANTEALQQLAQPKLIFAFLKNFLS